MKNILLLHAWIYLSLSLLTPMWMSLTLWRFDVQGWLDQYDKASMIRHIFSSLQGYPGKWACSLPKGRDISVSYLLAHMDRTFGNVCNCDTMIQCLYEICQKDGETVEEYMLQIHEVVVVICCAYPDRIADQSKSLTWDRFYHSLLLNFHDTRSFTMANLPKREQENMSFDTLYMLAKKSEAMQSSHSHKAGSGSMDAYRDRYQQRYPAPVGRVATLEEELFLPDPEVGVAEAPDAELPLQEHEVLRR